jgi:hypothetical protein
MHQKDSKNKAGGNQQKGRKLKKRESRDQQRMRNLASSRDNLVHCWILSAIAPNTTHLFVPANPTQSHWCMFVNCTIFITIISLNTNSGMYHLTPSSMARCKAVPINACNA